MTMLVQYLNGETWTTLKVCTAASLSDATAVGIYFSTAGFTDVRIVNSLFPTVSLWSISDP